MSEDGLGYERALDHVHQKLGDLHDLTGPVEEAVGDGVARHQRIVGFLVQPPCFVGQAFGGIDFFGLGPGVGIHLCDRRRTVQAGLMFTCTHSPACCEPIPQKSTKVPSSSTVVLFLGPS